MCIVIKQVVLLPFAWLFQAVTAHRNAHEPGVLKNKQNKCLEIVGLSEYVQRFLWETQLLLGHDKSGSLLLKDYGKQDGFPPANKSWLEGKWTGTGFSPQLSRQ